MSRATSAAPTPAMRCMPLRKYLMRLSWWCVLPVLILCVVLVVHQVYRLNERNERDASNQASNVMAAIDDRLETLIAALRMLAASPLVDDASRLSQFYDDALGFHHFFEDHVVLADPSMQMLLTTRVPLGTSPIPDAIVATISH